jgi:hypothetical protein
VIRREIVDERAEERRELARYRADLVAARLTLGRSLLLGALAGFVVFFVPVAVVGGSMLLISFTSVIGVLPFQWFFRLTGWRLAAPSPAAGGAAAASAAATAAAARGQGAVARATEIPPLPPEGPAAGGSEWLAVGLVLFWPLAMLVIGAAVAALYRGRRLRARDALSRAPVELAIVPEVALFYALTAGSGLLVGVGSFVAIAANAVFAWAGFLVWRWLFDHFAWLAAPAALRDQARAVVDRERHYRRRMREQA